MLTNWQVNKHYITFVEGNTTQSYKEIVTDGYDGRDESQKHCIMEPNND